MKEFAYIRVSSREQQEHRQIIAMEARGIPTERIYLEKLSGKDTKRPVLQKLMNAVKAGDKKQRNRTCPRSSWACRQ